ncbi:MAG: DNA-directed RNA polymerase subunit omega [Clostridia bacterium]|nr:DNA-directed RNA polymerase subunit omega [Clostridia bacterium]
MINDPSVDEMTKKLGSVEDPVSSYILCVVAAKRARQLIEQEQSKGVFALNANGDKEIVEACKEISEGKVGFVKD